MRLHSCSSSSTLAAMLLLAMLSGAPAPAEQGSAEMTVGATVVGSLETVETVGDEGQAVLLVTAPGEAVLSADPGVEVTGTPGSWTATATAQGSQALYVTITF